MKAKKSPLGSIAAIAAVTLLSTSLSWGAGDLPTKFTNIGGISNTRHNLTQNTLTSGGGNAMGPYRNNYQAVCVYCHTPHGANSDNIAAPLWNRTFLNTSYTTYDTLQTSTLTEAVTQPGVNSLTCLSCHDGTLAVDSIVNMPGSGNYSEASKTAQDNGFLDGWNNTGESDAGTHMTLSAPASATSCLGCHEPGAFAGGTATDFTIFAIGTDLTNDHPVGINAPTTRYGSDFNAPDVAIAGMEFYDTDGNSRPDKNEIRFYDTGEGPEVECASCHDPHGVAPTPGSEINLSFLRVSNDNSNVCQTCHDK